MKITYLVFLILIINNVYALDINEFLPNPLGDDAAPMPSGEYIELYNPLDSEINLENYYFLDALQNKLIISKNTTKETTNVLSYSLIVIYRNANTKFSLNNDKDEISLFNPNGTLLDYVSYNQTKENYSNSKVDNNWILLSQTPGSQNIVQESQQLPQTNNACDYDLQIIPQKQVFKENKIDFIISIQRLSGLQSQIILQRNIQDSQNNIIKRYEDLILYVPNKKEIEYTPTLKDPGTYKIYSKITALNCTDTPQKTDIKYFEIILEQNNTKSKTSSINISDIEPKEIRFGDYILLKLNIKKYNTQKNLITISLYNINKKEMSQQLKINLFGKDYEMDLDIPYYIKEYCDSGNYTILIEGLNTKNQKQVYIDKSSNCSNTQTKEISLQTQYENNLNSQIPEKKVVYEGFSQKSKDYTIILFIFVLILIIIKLLKEK